MLQHTHTSATHTRQNQYYSRLFVSFADRTVSPTSIMGRPTSHGSAASNPALQLVPALKTLLHSAIAPSTVATYERALKSFAIFLTQYSFPMQLPNPPVVVALYISYLHTNHYAYRSILTHLAAISYMHRSHLLAEPNQNFIIQKTLQGVKRTATLQDCRLPINLALLHKLCQTIKHILASPLQQAMFRSMYLLAFFAFLRVGEITISHGRSENILKLRQVIVQTGSNVVHIAFERYKHSNAKTHTMAIQSRPGPFCPVEALLQYLKLRGQQPGPLYVQPSNQPVTRATFNSTLQKSFKFLGLQADFYTSHSFRIGAASFAARNGMSDAQIRHMGRWASDAFKSYIRM